MTNQLVYGGTMKLYSNRAKELSDKLEPVKKSIEDYYVQRISDCISIDELVGVLGIMNEHKINFVGSRGYVYFSSSMVDMIEQFRDNDVNVNPQSALIFTRSCGLRKKVVELLGGYK